MVQHADIFERHAIASKLVLGVMIHDRLNFNSYVDTACKNAAKVINAVARIIPNHYGASSSKRHLLAMSILRYGAKRNRAKLISTS